jgi:hypothetical protein
MNVEEQTMSDDCSSGSDACAPSDSSATSDGALFAGMMIGGQRERPGEPKPDPTAPPPPPVHHHPPLSRREEFVLWILCLGFALQVLLLVLRRSP